MLSFTKHLRKELCQLYTILFREKKQRKYFQAHFMRPALPKSDKDIQVEKSIDLYPNEHSGKSTQQNNFKSNKV